MMGSILFFDVIRTIINIPERNNIILNCLHLFFKHHLLTEGISSNYLKAPNSHLGKAVRTATFKTIKENIIFLDGTDLSHFGTSQGRNNGGNNGDRRERQRQKADGEKKSAVSEPCTICKSNARFTHTTKEHKEPRSAARARQRDNPTAKGPNLDQVICHKCNEKGHYANRCPGTNSSTTASSIDKDAVRSRIAVLRQDGQKEGETNQDELTEELIAQAIFELEKKNNP